MIKVKINNNVSIGDENPLTIIAGPCVIESMELCHGIASKLKSISEELGVSLIFKASFDKANRTSLDSFRGPGIVEGIRILESVKQSLNIPILTDIHEVSQIEPLAEVADILQIPAFLCRQTDLLIEAGKSGKAVNIKKGQFMAPQDIQHAIHKVATSGNRRIIVTERGFTFGYNNLVVDMRSLEIMRSFGYPVIFDATHSVQTPAGKGNSSGGHREFIPCFDASITRCWHRRTIFGNPPTTFGGKIRWSEFNPSRSNKRPYSARSRNP